MSTNHETGVGASAWLQLPAVGVRPVNVPQFKVLYDVC